MSRNEGREIEVALALLFTGYPLFFSSLKAFKLRRRMADTPKSKIASAAIGRNVEIHAKVLCELGDLVTSPLSSTKVAAYIWDFQELVKRGKNSTWVTRNMFYSSPFIYLRDDSQAIAAVDLASCEFQQDIFSDTATFDDRTFEISDEVKEILRSQGILDTNKKGTFLSSSKFRIREGVLKEGVLLYVLGTAHIPPTVERSMVKQDLNSFGNRSITLKERIAKAFKKHLQNPKTIARFDKNGNGVLDKNEKDAVFMALEKKAMSITATNNKIDYLGSTRIFFSLDNGADEFMMLDKVYVSTNSEEKTTTSLLGHGYLGLIGGPLMVVAAVLLLIYKFNLD